MWSACEYCTVLFGARADCGQTTDVCVQHASYNTPLYTTAYPVECGKALGLLHFAIWPSFDVELAAELFEGCQTHFEFDCRNLDRQVVVVLELFKRNLVWNAPLCVAQAHWLDVLSVWRVCTRALR